MTHDSICNWLGLPGEVWPPDHYRLLGLATGEADAARIEQQVHDRLEAVRRYQLLHPEHATEAMNRLAQAFVCLTDPEARKAYDAKLLQPAPTPAPAMDGAIEGLSAVESADPLSWIYDRDFGRAETQLEIPTVADRPQMEEAEQQKVEASSESWISDRPNLVPPPVRRPAVPVAEKEDVILQAAHSSLPARRVLGTKRAFYHRMARTRELLRAWSEAGEYLGHPGRKLAKPIEATNLIHALITLRTELKSFPPLLGQAGQPGYLVVALARQQVIVPTFQTLLPSQRDALARDWRAGLKLLHAHVQVLRDELRAMRRRGLLRRTLRVGHSLVHSHLGLLILGLGFLAVLLALWRSLPTGSAEEPVPAPESPRRVSIGPLPRPLWESNVSWPNQAKEPAHVPAEREPMDLKHEGLPTKASTSPPPVTVEEPLTDKKEQAAVERRFQADDTINSVTSVGFLSNDRFLYSNDHAKLHLWNLVRGEAEDDVNKFADPLTCVTVCPRTGCVACGDETGRIYVLHDEAGVHWSFQALEKNHADTIHALAFSADGKLLISGGKDGKVQLWDVKAAKAGNTLAKLEQTVRAVALSSDGSRAIAAGDDRFVHVWDTKTGQKLGQWEGHTATVTSVAMSRDGRIAFTGGKEGAVFRWNVEQPSKTPQKATVQSKVTCLALSPDDRTLASGEINGQIHLWNVDQLRTPRAVDAANDPVFSIVFSPDGKWLLSGQAAGKIVLLPLEGAAPRSK